MSGNAWPLLPLYTLGRCLLLLDGLDEVASKERRAATTRWILRPTPTAPGPGASLETVTLDLVIEGAEADAEARGGLFEHCALALDRSLSVGGHGLPLMGVSTNAAERPSIRRQKRAATRGERLWL